MTSRLINVFFGLRPNFPFYRPSPARRPLKQFYSQRLRRRLRSRKMNTGPPTSAVTTLTGSSTLSRVRAAVSQRVRNAPPTRNDAGNRVLEMLADYQKRSNGGDGWLRLIRLAPHTRQLQIRTYSPALNQFETDPNSQFTVPWDLPDTCRRGTGQALAVGG